MQENSCYCYFSVLLGYNAQFLSALPQPSAAAHAFFLYSLLNTISVSRQSHVRPMRLLTRHWGGGAGPNP